MRLRKRGFNSVLTFALRLTLTLILFRYSIFYKINLHDFLIEIIFIIFDLIRNYRFAQRGFPS